MQIFTTKMVITNKSGISHSRSPLGDFFIKNYKDGKYSYRCGLLSYIGFVMVLLGVILLMEPIFTSLPGNLANIAPSVITMFTCIIVGKLLLKPTFLKSKKDES